MNLKIRFKVRDEEGKDKEVSRTFSNINPSAENEKLIEFANAYMSLTSISDYSVEKIRTEEIA